MSINFFQKQSYIKVCISNTSLRSVTIIQITCSVNDRVFHQCIPETETICLPPATVQTVLIKKCELLDSYVKQPMSILCQNDDHDLIEIMLYDDFGRTYLIEENITVETLRT